MGGSDQSDQELRVGLPRVSILAVEDCVRDGELLRAQLTAEAGGEWCQVSTVCTLAEALRALQAGPVDVILLDLNLSDSRGWDTFEGVQTAAPDAAVILVSGGNHEELAAKAIKHGAQDYVNKTDLNARTLTRAVRYAVERKAAERQLRRYQEDLEELVRSRTQRIQETNDALRREVEERRRAEAELRRAMDLLREHDEAKSRFVSNVSHELKTPLASMSYAIENLLRGVVGTMDEACRSYIVMLEEDCRRLVHTIGDVLDLSRIETGTLTLHRVVLALHRFVGHAVGSLGMLAEEKGLHMRQTLCPVKAFVEGDPHKLERVIMNVVQNAIKYTPEGGSVDLTLRQASPPDGWIVLEVSDTGVGIPAECLPKVGERHFRGGAQMRGAGLGLSIAREIIDRHGGRLHIESPVPGSTCGTRVSLFLPEVPPPCVMVAAGNAEVRAAVKHELAAEGYAVRMFADGGDAWRQLDEGDTPHAVISDFALAGMDGVEFIARVKSDPRLQRLPLVVVADRADDAGALRELMEGFRLPRLSMPMREGDIVRAVEHAAQEHAHAET